MRSAPSRLPRSAPLPDPALVTKKVMLGDCGACWAIAPALQPRAAMAAEPSSDIRVLLFIGSSHLFLVVRSRYATCHIVLHSGRWNEHVLFEPIGLLLADIFADFLIELRP